MRAKIASIAAPSIAGTRADAIFAAACRVTMQKRAPHARRPSSAAGRGRELPGPRNYAAIGVAAIQSGHTLATSGVYRRIRHPSYLGLLVSSLGWGLAFRSGAGVLLAALMVPPIVARIRAEERLLRSEFGAEYDAYRARSSRLIPGLY
ncbi:MAG: methyltransferase family protein [Beijerinckiaceae bacterium]